MSNMTTGTKVVSKINIYVNETQLSKQQPNIRSFVGTIE